MVRRQVGFSCLVEATREWGNTFNELYKTIPSISEKMLSTVLRSLVTDGLVSRKIYPSVPPKVEYYVSEFGETLIPHLERLKQWGQENFETIMENRQKNKY